MNQQIYIRRRSKVLLPERHEARSTPIQVVASLAKNIENLGFRLSIEVLEELTARAPAQVDAFYNDVVSTLRTLVGAHRRFEPLYPNFPKQVMEASEAVLYFTAMVHYQTLLRPLFATEERPAIAEQPQFRLLRFGDAADFDSLFTTLLSSKVAYSAQDKLDVAWFVERHREDIALLLPESIPSKENLATFGAALCRVAGSDAAGILDRYIKTATDVLRLAVGMSAGDVSLAEASKFGKFRRPQRVMLLDWIERAPNAAEDMRRWKPRWIRLGERLHPREYIERFPRTAAAFDVLRNNRPLDTFNRRIEAGLLARDTQAVLDQLEARPGELARRLDHLARTTSSPQSVVERFAARAEGVSTPVLLQVFTHFRHRAQPASLRVFFPKGQIGNLFATTRPLPPMPAEIAGELAGVCERALLARFSQLAPLGKCYLDPLLKKYLAPFAQRSASKSLRTLVRGSRLPFPECSTLRFFVWWMNGSDRTDIDLSAAMYGPQYEFIDTLAYYNLKNFGAHHSGDIVDAPQGAAEFIDIDLTRCRAAGVRYVVMSLNSFSMQPYCNLPECFAGWMARQTPGSGEIFEPKTVMNKVDLAADTRICLPAVFDLETRETLWTDIALSRHPSFQNNVLNNLSGVSLMLRAMTQLRKLDLYTLFDLHVRARGQRVEDRAEADAVFSTDEGITPYDLDRISAEFM